VSHKGLLLLATVIMLTIGAGIVGAANAKVSQAVNAPSCATSYCGP
jgi:hypothetical protein